MIKLERTTKRYIGSSLDTKPVELEDGKALPAGSTFLENDTARIFYWDGIEWKQGITYITVNPALGMDDTLETLQKILVEITDLRRHVELALK
jgi:hypothetical protein